MAGTDPPVAVKGTPPTIAKLRTNGRTTVIILNPAPTQAR
jgi:hypothetical protein